VITGRRVGSGGRWTKRKKSDLRSRVTGTSLGKSTRVAPSDPAIADFRPRPRLLTARRGTSCCVNCSPGSRFPGRTGVAWVVGGPIDCEAGAFDRAAAHRAGARSDGGVAHMLRPIQIGLGGKLGSGTQWSPGSVADLVQLILFFNDHDTIHGPVNAVSPHRSPMPFHGQLGNVLHRPTWFLTAAPLLRLAWGHSPISSSPRNGSYRKSPPGELPFQYPICGSSQQTGGA